MYKRKYGLWNKPYAKKARSSTGLARRVASAIANAPAPRRRIGAISRLLPKLALRGRSGGELKFVDTVITAASMNLTGLVQPVNLIAQGDDYNQRDGRRVSLRSFMIRAKAIPEDATTLPTLCRLMLVLDKQSNSGAVPGLTTIITGFTSASFQNLDNRDRFVVLWDKQFVIGGQDTTTATAVYTQTPTIVNIKKYINLKGVQTTFSGTTGVIGSIATNSLLLVQVADSASTSAVSIVGQTRIRFNESS